PAPRPPPLSLPDALPISVKVLLISPFIVDYVGNVLRMLVLSPWAWYDRARVQREFRDYLRPVAIVSVLGPLGYILVLYAMQIARSEEHTSELQSRENLVC